MVLGDRPLMYRFVLDRASPEWLDDWDDVVLGDAAGMVREGYVCNINKAKPPISTIVWQQVQPPGKLKTGVWIHYNHNREILADNLLI